MKPRVKRPTSILKKCQREDNKVENLDEIPEKIEDLLGIRIVTVNKEQARRLFDELRRFHEKENTWFCETDKPPNFVQYTIQDKNNYSLRTGYQAYHITFIFTRSYAPFHKIARWPVEIQIMSQLWDFWAEYSRKYFYGGVESDSQLPYNLAISRILDSADELMVTTAQILTQVPEKQAPRATTGVTPLQVGDWFDKNLDKYLGSTARKPIDFFINKIAEELNLHGISLSELEKILSDKIIRAQYNAILDDSRIDFIPPYQEILCFVLLSRGLKPDRVVERVNNELRLLGITLWAPPESYLKT